jgi:hypothetical protein
MIGETTRSKTIMNNLPIFGHHPDADTDWVIEWEELENVISNLALGLTGFGHEQEYDRLGHRLAKFLDFRTLDAQILEMKRQLREHIREAGYSMSSMAYIGDPVRLWRPPSDNSHDPR